MIVILSNNITLKIPVKVNTKNVPTKTPSINGNVFKNPILEELEDDIMLFGPGVKVPTKT